MNVRKAKILWLAILPPLAYLDYQALMTMYWLVNSLTAVLRSLVYAGVRL